MKKASDQIIEIFTQEGIDSFRDPASWEQLSTEELNTLAYLFLVSGEECIGDGAIEPEEFKIAQTLAPDDAHLYYRLATAFYDSVPIPCLDKVEFYLDKSLLIEPNFFDALKFRGRVWMDRGIEEKDMDLLEQANRLFEKVALEENEVDPGFLWCRGACYYSLAKLSGEAGDYSNALKLLRLADQEGKSSPHFYNDLANTLVDLGFLISQIDLLKEGVAYYRKAIELKYDFFDYWLNLACTCQGIFDLTGEKEWFDKANKLYEKVTKMENEEGAAWIKWGLLLLDWGKANRDTESLVKSIEKFKVASSRHSDQSLILAYMAQAELDLGRFQNSVNDLRSAEKKAKQSAELDPTQSFSFFVWGHALQALGLYFEDERYFEQAVEVAEKAVKLDGSNSYYWLALAKAHFHLGTLLEDEREIDHSLHAFEMGSQCGKKKPLQYLDEWGQAWLRKGLLSEDPRAIEQALSKFAQGVDLFKKGSPNTQVPNEWVYRYSVALRLLGEYLEDPKRIEEAISIFHHLLKGDPEGFSILFQLALAHQHLGELNGSYDTFMGACHYFEQVIEFDRDNELAWQEWGVALSHLADFLHDSSCLEKQTALLLSAKEKCLHALSLGHEPSLYQLACIFSMLGQKREAVQYLKLAEQADVLPSHEIMLEDEWLMKNLVDYSPFNKFMGMNHHE